MVETGVHTSFHNGKSEIEHRNTERIDELVRRVASVEHRVGSVAFNKVVEHRDAVCVELASREEVRCATTECKAEARALVQALRDHFLDMCHEWRSTEQLVDGLRCKLYVEPNDWHQKSCFGREERIELPTDQPRDPLLDCSGSHIDDSTDPNRWAVAQDLLPVIGTTSKMGLKDQASHVAVLDSQFLQAPSPAILLSRSNSPDVPANSPEVHVDASGFLSREDYSKQSLRAEISGLGRLGRPSSELSGRTALSDRYEKCRKDKSTVRSEVGRVRFTDPCSFSTDK